MSGLKPRPSIETVRIWNSEPLLRNCKGLYPEPKARWSKNFALPDRFRQAYHTLCDAQFQPRGLPSRSPALLLFLTKCNNVPPDHGYYTTFTLPRSRGRPPTLVNGQAQFPIRVSHRRHRRYRVGGYKRSLQRELLHRSRKRARHRRWLRSQT